MFFFLKKNTIKNKNFILYDQMLLWLTISLLIIGFIMVFSASLSLGKSLYQDSFFFIKKECIFLFIIFCLFFIFLRLPMTLIEKNSNFILIVSIFLLFIVLLTDAPTHGYIGWIKIGILHIQPSEICKIGSFCYIAKYLSKKKKKIKNNFWDLFKPISIISIESILLLAEPDLGTIIILFATTLSILFISGAKIRQLLIIMIIFVFIILMIIFIAPYNINKILPFWNSSNNSLGSIYQLNPLSLTLGIDNFFGKGLGNSIKIFNYLPETYSDFVFSIIGEELGYIGRLLVLLMLFSVSFRAIYIGKKAFQRKQMFSGFLACSFGIWFILQTLMNIGAVNNLFPIKESTLPLISYGGSSLITISIAIFLLLRIDFENRLSTIQAFPRGSNNS